MKTKNFITLANLQLYSSPPVIVKWDTGNLRLTWSRDFHATSRAYEILINCLCMIKTWLTRKAKKKKKLCSITPTVQYNSGFCSEILGKDMRVPRCKARYHDAEAALANINFHLPAFLLLKYYYKNTILPKFWENNVFIIYYSCFRRGVFPWLGSPTGGKHLIDFYYRLMISKERRTLDFLSFKSSE